MWCIPKDKPRIKQFRKWLAYRLVAWSRKVHPGNEAAIAFDMSIMTDMLIHGKVITKVDLSEYYTDSPATQRE